MDSSEETKPRQKRKTADITAKDDPFGRSEKDTDHKKKKLTAAQRTHERKISYVSKKYKRGSQADLSSIDDKKLAGATRRHEHQTKNAVDQAARAEILLPSQAGFLEPEGELDNTWKVKQDDIKQAVDLTSANKIFDLKLDKFGPYVVDYSRNGRHLVFGGEKGHLALVDWHRNKLQCEINVKENVRDVTFLHNETMFAVAQKQYVYIYDKQGTELHRMKDHVNPLKLEFLPYHFLLATVGQQGILRYHDTSTGQLLVEHKTKLGLCNTMTQNPRNAILHLGHQTGVVTLWSPNMAQPHVKMLCHRGPVNDVAVDAMGNYMVTAGVDGRVSIWDLRTYKSLQTLYTRRPVQHLTISQTGLLATSSGPHVQIWKDYVNTHPKAPYMNHDLPGGGNVRSVEFCPFDDVLGLGHNNGFSSIVVPGAGEANFDTFEVNPFETKRQRREATVTRLLEKIQPDMITLEANSLGSVTKTDKEKHSQDVKTTFEANNPGKQWAGVRKEKRTQRKTRHKSKQTNVVDKRQQEKREANRKALLEKHDRALAGEADGEDESAKIASRSALDRFSKR